MRRKFWRDQPQGWDRSFKAIRLPCKGALHKLRHALDAPKVFWSQVIIGYGNGKLLLEESDQVQDAERIDDSVLQEIVAIVHAALAGMGKLLKHKLPNAPDCIAVP